MYIFKPPYPYYSKNIRDYCMKSTNDYIKRITEKCNLERNSNNNIKIDNPLVIKKEDNPEDNFNKFLVILSISTLGLYLYRRLKD